MVHDVEKSPTQAEKEILSQIVELDRARILSMAEKLEKGGIQNLLREAHSRLSSGEVKLEPRVTPEFKLWLERCPFVAAPPRTWKPESVAFLIHWSSQARRFHSESLKNLLGVERAQKPPWLESLRKIARYHFAIKSMIKLAAQEPDLFANIHIEAVGAFGLRPFSILKEKAPLLTAVKRLVNGDPGVIMEQLEKHLGTHDVEAVMRKACRLKLTLHAEMQLVVFYEGEPTLSPWMRFIGTSKKACFHCHEYLLKHPLRLQVSACHQKVYPSWLPPPYYPIPGKFKSKPFIEFNKSIEKLAKDELRTALNAPPRPNVQDSTAGPSLTLTATVRTGPGVGLATRVPYVPEDSRSDIIE